MPHAATNTCRTGCRAAASLGRRALRRAGLTLLAAVAAVAIASCAREAMDVRPPVELPAAFSSDGAAAMPETWWTAFGDEQLDALVREALAGNFSLRVAWDRLDQARAIAEASEAPLWPTLDGTAGASRTLQRTPARGRTYATEYSLGVLAGYEVDLWGRIRSTVDAARLDVAASAGDLQAAGITLAAEVAGTWYTLVEQRGQLRILNEQLATNEQYLDVITLRFRRGQASAADVLQQRQLVESTRGDQRLVEAAIAVLENRLAVLLGRTPGALAVAAPDALPGLPPPPAAGLPADWVRRRPDVAAAERRVEAADRRVAAAIADQFPRLGLTVAAETGAEQVRDLFDNWLASLAANLTAPLFDGGRRAAEVRRTRAVVSERLNTYGQVVLESLEEVEDALVQEAKQAAYVASLGRQLQLAKDATDRIRDSYMGTGTDFVRYLTTLLSYQRLQRTHLQAQRDLVAFRIDLYRALAGGWPMTRPTTTTVAGGAETEAPPEETEPTEAAPPKDEGF